MKELVHGGAETAGAEQVVVGGAFAGVGVAAFVAADGVAVGTLESVVGKETGDVFEMAIVGASGPGGAAQGFLAFEAVGGFVLSFVDVGANPDLFLALGDETVGRFAVGAHVFGEGASDQVGVGTDGERHFGRAEGLELFGIEEEFFVADAAIHLLDMALGLSAAGAAARPQDD